jgi:hypothetical protein
MIIDAKNFTGAFAEGRDQIGLLTFSDGYYLESKPTTVNFQTVLGYSNSSGSALGPSTTSTATVARERPRRFPWPTTSCTNCRAWRDEHHHAGDGRIAQHAGLQFLCRDSRARRAKHHQQLSGRQQPDVTRTAGWKTVAIGAAVDLGNLHEYGRHRIHVQCPGRRNRGVLCGRSQRKLHRAALYDRSVRSPANGR